MKRSIVIFLIFIFFVTPSYSATKGSENNPQNFSDLGKYKEILEINETEQTNKETKDNDFEEFAIYDVAKRYENNAVELKLNEVKDDALELVNNERIYKLKINETQYQIENEIKNENMIWDSSKSFIEGYFNSTRHLAPIPGIVNSSKITAAASTISAQMGQVYLNDANGPTVLFVRANESTYNIGSIVTYKGSKINLSTGSFASSYNWASSGGAVLSSNSIELPQNTGSIVLGGALFSNEGLEADKATGGGFIEYTYKRFKINAQLGQSKFSNSDDLYTSLYLIPELKISDTLYLKTRFIRNVSENTMQDELVLTYKPKNNKNNLEFEINTSNQYTNTSNINQRIKFTTSFKI